MIWLRMLRPYRGRLAVLFPAVVLGVCATLSAPLVLRYGIDHGLSDHIDAGVLRTCALIYLVIALTNLGLQFAQIRIAGAIGEAFVRDVRRRTFRHLMGMDSAYFDSHQSGALIARQTADIDALQDVVQVGGVQFVQAVFSLVGLGVLLLVLSWKLSLLCLAAPLVPLLYASWRFRRHSAPVNNELRDRVGATMGSLAEGLAGMRVVRAFGQEQRMFGRFAQRLDEQLTTYLRSVKIEARYLREMEACTGLAMVIAVGGGVMLVQRGEISAGTLSAFILYLLMIFDPLQALGYLLTMLQAALAALRKLSILLDTEPELAPGTVPTLPAGGDIELHEVDFGYGDGPPVLRQVSVTIRAGETFALVGPTGAGKSTLAKLAARLHDPTGGAVTYAGVDLRDVTFEALRSQIIMASQEGHLFQGTVLENVQAGRPGASPEDALQAIDMVGVGSVIDTLPEGPQTPVGERGAFLSAGQRQAVSLARTALSDASVVVLDETTSSMDPGTEAIVHRAVTRLAQGRTLIIIAHRLSTVRDSDRIAVIADGGIAEIGTPAELIAAGGRYASLSNAWDSARDMTIDELVESTTTGPA